MAYYNVMERIRKIAGLPSMRGGVPPRDRRKCSDWASFTEAVDTVTGELVGELVACKESYARLAAKNSEQAGRIAEMTEQARKDDKKCLRSGLFATALSHDLTPSQREAVIEVIDGN